MEIFLGFANFFLPKYMVFRKFSEGRFGRKDYSFVSSFAGGFLKKTRVPGASVKGVAGCRLGKVDFFPRRARVGPYERKSVKGCGGLVETKCEIEITTRALYLGKTTLYRMTVRCALFGTF